VLSVCGGGIFFGERKKNVGTIETEKKERKGERERECV